MPTTAAGSHDFSLSPPSGIYTVVKFDEVIYAKMARGYYEDT